MGDCRYCGESAGFLRSAHSACENKYASGRSAMVGLATDAAMGRTGLGTLEQELTRVADANLVPREQVRTVLSEGLDAAVDVMFDDGLLTNEEEERVRAYMRRFSLERDGNTIERLAQGAVIRDVCAGGLPDASYFEDMDLPFNFQKSESLVWVFSGVDYYERRTRRIRRGGSQGVSIRVMRGVYYQPRVFQSESIERNVTEHVDSGTVAVTDKHIYFSGREKSFRVNYTRIVSFDGYAEGFGLVRDAANARPQIFLTGDGWFSYNLVSNLAQRRA